MQDKKEIDALEKDYLNDLNKIKETIRTNQNKVMVVVNSAMIMMYYEIGTIINKRKAWGNKYIQKLSNDLKEYENLYRMIKFSEEFSIDEIMSQPVTQIPWGTLVTVIMPKSRSHEEMLWYINETHKYGWSRSMVLNQIALKAYERSLISPTTTEAMTPNDSILELDCFLVLSI